tara:strand:+ start:94 stop:834 length:741 start_codon:yes stop_codon:yes gene_type:complete
VSSGTTILAGHIIIASVKAIKRLYRHLRPHNIGFYGPTLTGKTTLDQYLTVPGDIEPIPAEFRTTHLKNRHGDYIMPDAHRKQMKWKKERFPLQSADIGGQSQFRNMWIDDMFSRKVDVVFFMVDERVLHSPQFTIEAIASLKYLVDNITRRNMTKQISRKAKKHAKKGYKPELFCFLINKMDLWWSPQAQYLWDNGLQREHPIVYPFREQLRILRTAGIQAEVEAISAQHGMNVEKVMVKMIETL